MLRFDGQVAVVTGAGGGLGREYALLFAERGASVVVNDLGSGVQGNGHETQMADKVVQEIKTKGGKAVANYESVENGESIIKTALENFGRVDIVVNNAGILRDKSFKNMTEADWDLVYKVHLKGAFNITKAAWNHMCNQKYGRIIMTSSNSAIYGNFGQANYSAVKSALIGMCKTLAVEGAKYNVHCNTLVPTAGSRLSKNVLPEEIFHLLKPEYVSPLVIWLCHESCQETGQLYEAGGGWFGKLHYLRSNGKVLKNAGGKITPEDLEQNWDEISDMTRDAKHFDSIESVTADLVEKSRDSPAKTDSLNFYTSKDDPRSTCRSTRFDPMELHYTQKDTILYAVSIGATVDKHLNLLYENHENFTVFPTFAVVPDFRVYAKIVELKIPRVTLDPTKLVHGEQYFEFKKPFEPSGHVTSYCRIADILNKGNSIVVLLNVDLKNEQNEVLVSSQSAIFFRNTHGFNGYRNSQEEFKIVDVPKRKADHVIEEKTSLSQPALYRQAAGDYNPIHIDPDFAKIAGFERPIMHGLNTLAFSLRHIFDTYSRDDYANLITVKVRFSNPVFPGQTLMTEMWRDGAKNRIQFQTTVKETKKVVISGGYADFRSLDGRKLVQPTKISEKKADLKSSVIFEEIHKKISINKEIVKQIQAVYLWIITKNGEAAAKYTMDLKTDGAVYMGEPKSGKLADVTLTLSDEDMVKLASGTLNSQQAFLSGKLKIKGNIMLSQKLQKIFQEQSKL